MGRNVNFIRSLSYDTIDDVVSLVYLPRHVSDKELIEHLQRLHTNSPYIGEYMILGYLRAMNIQAIRERVRHILRCIDPLNTALQWGGNLNSRRPYSVPGPNSLWHIGIILWYFIQLYRWPS